MTTAQATPIVQATDLKEAVTAIHGQAQDGFEAIATVAQLALHRMESPDVYKNLEPIAQALRVIWCTAEEACHAIGCEAEATGASSVNAAKMRRLAAHQQTKGVAA